MPDQFMHGITITEVNEGARSLVTVATAVIGLVATATAPVGAALNALNAAFPLNKAVLVNDMSAAIGVAGTGGTLRGVLTAISDQVTCPVVVVRVATGADAAGTDANVIGATVDGVKTGMQALLAAEAQLGVKPRILGAPGLDTQAVTAALIVVAQKLRGMAYAAANGVDTAAAIAYRANFSARELMLLYPDFIAFDQVAAANATSFGTARILGLRAHRSRAGLAQDDFQCRSAGRPRPHQGYPIRHPGFRLRGEPAQREGDHRADPRWRRFPRLGQPHLLR